MSKAAKLESDLILDRFDWGDWRKNTTNPNTTNSAHGWVKTFLDWKRETVKDTTIRNDYEPYTQLIDCTGALTNTLLTEACRHNTRARKACVRCFKELGRYAGLKSDWSGLGGNYQPEAFDLDDLPTDEMIEQTWESIDSQLVQRMYGVLATYGIRPHELYHLDCSRLGKNDVLTVLRGKTGRRIVSPCKAEWVEAFRLWDIHAPTAKPGLSNKRLEERTNKSFHLSRSAPAAKPRALEL